VKIQSLQFIISAASPSQFPKGRLPEIAFSGRSNVGKSSLLNCLVGAKIAKISGTPGKTQTINFFLINDKLHFVDLPGYGYAKVSKAMQQSWRRLIEDYISRRENLKAVVVILDARREQIQASDLQMIEYVLSIGIPCIPVFTKVDKLNRSEQARLRKDVFSQLSADLKPIPFSAVTGEGKKALQDVLSKFLADM
jgi:GTP-binding protein